MSEATDIDLVRCYLTCAPPAERQVLDAFDRLAGALQAQAQPTDIASDLEIVRQNLPMTMRNESNPSRRAFERLTTVLRALIRQNAALSEEVRSVINRDRTGLAAGLNQVQQIVTGWRWIAEGHWGSYSHEEQTVETLQKEVRDLIDGVLSVAGLALKESGQRAHEAAHWAVGDGAPKKQEAGRGHEKYHRVRREVRRLNACLVRLSHERLPAASQRSVERLEREFAAEKAAHEATKVALEAERREVKHQRTRVDDWENCARQLQEEVNSSKRSAPETIALAKDLRLVEKQVESCGNDELTAAFDHIAGTLAYRPVHPIPFVVAGTPQLRAFASYDVSDREIVRGVIEVMRNSLGMGGTPEEAVCRVEWSYGLAAPEARHPDVGDKPVTDVDAAMIINGHRREFVKGVRYYLDELLEGDQPWHVIGHIEGKCADYTKLIRDARESERPILVGSKWRHAPVSGFSIGEREVSSFTPGADYPIITMFNGGKWSVKVFREHWEWLSDPPAAEPPLVDLEPERTMPRALALLQKLSSGDEYERTAFPVDEAVCKSCRLTFRDHVSGGKDCGEWSEAEPVTGEPYLPKPGERVRVVTIRPPDGFEVPRLRIGDDGDVLSAARGTSMDFADWVKVRLVGKSGAITWCRVEPAPASAAPPGSDT